MKIYQVIYDYVSDDWEVTTLSETFESYRDAMDYMDYLRESYCYENIELIDLSEMYGL